MSTHNLPTPPPAPVDVARVAATRLADLYDGDRHTTGRDSVARANVVIPHPLAGVTYADGVAPGSIRDRRLMAWAARP